MGMKMMQLMMNQFAENYAKKGLVRLREIFMPGTLTVPKTPAALKELESIHKVKAPPLFPSLCFKLLGSLERSSKRVSLDVTIRLVGSINVHDHVQFP